MSPCWQQKTLRQLQREAIRAVKALTRLLWLYELLPRARIYLARKASARPGHFVAARAVRVKRSIKITAREAGEVTSAAP
ncbi:hypothetical protein EVAR_66381_1 [Eumeta japonica]|uniref:Uncharacterized protein n=1 Tax=Eumeta variegata TaxID=151549 RepID=A0A4C1ZKR7_EUMVA|nr:hypothetical protein EVAR_66381_1 [Eumeta japonica]